VTTSRTPAAQQRAEARKRRSEAAREPRPHSAPTRRGRASETTWDVLAAAVPVPGRGEPLAPSVRSDFERSLAIDLSGVRLHTGADAAASARRERASAYTVGSQIAFAGGAPDVRRRRDRRLLAHELVHFAQQAMGRRRDNDGAAAARSGTVEPAATRAALSGTAELERQAELGADIMLAGARVPPVASVRPGTVQRQAAGAAAPEAAPSGVFTGDGVWVVVPFKGAWVSHLLRAPAGQRVPFERDPERARAFARDVGRMLAEFGPRESVAWVGGERVRSLLEADLPAWLAGSDLRQLRTALDERRGARAEQRVRPLVDQHILDWGIDPATVDWNIELPWLAAHPPFVPTTLLDASYLDRYALLVDLLVGEVAGEPPVLGAVRPNGERLRTALLSFALTGMSVTATGRRAFSEAFLDEWASQIAAVRFVPEGFDPSTLAVAASREEDDAERERVLGFFMASTAPRLVERHILDDWVRSRQSSEEFLAELDLGAYRASLVPRLTESFLSMAQTDVTLQAALRDAQIDEARRGVLASIFGFGRQLEQRHAQLVADLARAPADEASAFERGVAADPYSYLVRASTIADATCALLERPDAPGLVSAVVALGAAIAAGTDLPAGYGSVPAWIGLLGAIARIRELREEHARRSRELMSERFGLAYDQIAAVVRERADFARRFIESEWIPTVKAVALERITKNRDDLKQWLDNFGPETERRAAQYEVSASMLEHIVAGLRDGTYTGAQLPEGREIGREDIPEVETTIKLLRALAGQLSTPAKREEKREKLEKAVEAFDKVRGHILDGTYKPHQFGPEVFAEARVRLGIEWFTRYPFATVGDVLARDVVAESNPFVAYAVTAWSFSEQAADEARMLVIVFGTTALAILGLVSGFLALAVAARVLLLVDIGIGITLAGKNVLDAYRTLEMARLDVDLTVLGVTEDEAERALRHAWIQFAATLLLTVGVPAFLRVLRLVGRGLGLEPLELPNVARLQRDNPEGLRALMRVLPDILAVERLLARVDGSLARAQSLLAYVSSPAELNALLGRVPDPMVLESLLIGINRRQSSGARLIALLDRIADAARLDRYLYELGYDRTRRIASVVTDAEFAELANELRMDNLRRIADDHSGQALRTRLFDVLANKAPLRAEAAAARATHLPGTEPTQGNVATLRFDDASGGAPLSQRATSRMTAPLPDRPRPRSQGGQFEPSVDSRSGRVMDTDPEYKVMAWLGEQLDARHPGSPQAARGRVYLYSEMYLCDSCQSVVRQFRTKFPNVEVYVLWDLPFRGRNAP